jgi:O-phospho-L-seryl-tRNASec:L-selenocysteinyl-tRNA synthase
MDDQCIKLMKQFVPGTYVDSGAASLRTRNKLLRQLLSQRRLPDVGWEDSTIVWMLETLSRMDSNNFDGSAGLGEREGRVSSGLVARRHWGLAHGIGRSGDIAAVQPKAAGSSLLAQLTHALVLDAIKLAGMRAAKAAIVLPVATGMALLLTLITMRKRRPAGARYVVVRCVRMCWHLFDLLLTSPYSLLLPYFPRPASLPFPLFVVAAH